MNADEDFSDDQLVHISGAVVVHSCAVFFGLLLDCRFFVLLHVYLCWLSRSKLYRCKCTYPYVTLLFCILQQSRASFLASEQ